MMFTKSEELLDRALKVIPNGTQTFSKSRTNLPLGASPFYAARAEGARLWDVDGNEYTDFTSGLTAIILGYNDPDVNAAVKEQLECGVIFSLPHKLEIEVSELICEMTGAEMVRFGKNGSDATAGAVRLARAYTGRGHIAQCGYHGWQDWCIGVTGRNLGVPQAVRDLTHTFDYNDIDSLRRLFKDRPNQYAAVIMEPMNKEWPKDGFLHEVRELAHANGALFILDEVITGFRFAVGGAQEHFGIQADLVTYGKAIANGYPLSVVAGKAEIMRRMEDIHFSFTNAGECLSLAAAKACLNKIRREDVPKYLLLLGQDLPGTGHPSWRHLNFAGMEEKTLFLQEMHRRGILCLGTINLNYAHTHKDVEKFWQALQAAREEDLVCEPLKPIFKIR